MKPQTITSSTPWAGCAWETTLSVGDDGARLRPRHLVCDELGGVTSRTFERLQGDVWAKKTFVLEQATAEAAELVIRVDCGGPWPSRPPEGKRLLVEVNGHLIEHQGTKEASSWQGPVDDYWSTGWQIVPVPPEVLRVGANEVILRDGSGEGWRLYIDNHFGPRRSAKSIDGGQTWTSERLGLNDFCQGEYVVRLNLKRYAPAGVVTSPFIDLLALASEGPIAPRGRVRQVALKPRLETPAGTNIELEWRSGSTPSYQPSTWSPWAPASGPLRPAADHRFGQWRARLATAEPLATPWLQEVAVEATVEVEEAVPLSVTAWHNDPLVRSAHPFAHQLADEPRLALLRDRWRLDHVVEGAKTEFEKILRLRRWTRQQWENGWDRGPLQFVPPWDAMVVLELASRQLTLGMCTHYASTFVQCCLAIGLVARVALITAHCVAEVWSNEFGKWVMMDPGCDVDDGRKGTRHFERHGVPMSCLDLHRAHVNRDYEGVVEVNDPEKFGDTLEQNIALYRQFCIPLRNNFLTSLVPEEPEHGAVAYTYDGHLWWASEAMPLPQFSRLSRREGDYHWSVNQTQIFLQAGAEPNTLRVQLDTVTPNFDTYLVQCNDGEWEERGDEFVWALAPGANTLRAKTRNAFGLEGRESWVRVEV